MEDDKLGLSFRETMTGGFSLGETDPGEGEGRGKAEGTVLAMHATVAIHDLDKFIADPEHTGSLSGHIDFTPFGDNIPAKTGVFNLFSPAEDPEMKLMVYELGFEHEGESYYLAGRKEVKDDPGFDLWKDTTTLFTQLHRGSDKSGEVVGAGVLSLGLSDLISLLRTVEVTNSQSTGDKAQAILKFGRFFLGELWGSYAKFVT